MRSYRDLVRIQSYQRGLEALIHSIADITQIDNIMELSNAVLEQIKSVLNAENTHFLVKETEAFSLVQTDEHCWNISIGESCASFVEADNNKSEEPIAKLAQQCFQQKDHLIKPPYYCHYYRSARGTESTFVVKGLGELTPTSLKLVKLFSINIIVTIEKLLITQ
nr:DUF3369 domain-containing protein [Thalassotalea sp. G2M2-11]